MGKTIDKELIQGIISEAGVDMVLITDPYNLRYYTGFRGGEGVAVMTRDRYVLITDSRYTEEASKESDFEVIEFNMTRSKKSIIIALAKECGAENVGFEDDNISYQEYKMYDELTSYET